jgi:SulP family sulfate permease
MVGSASPVSTPTWPARTVPVSVQPPDRVFGATPVLGESTWAALHEARAWVVDASA